MVVDTEVTAKKLVQRGNLQYRTTFIPLNKIQGGKIDNNTIKLAQDLVNFKMYFIKNNIVNTINSAVWSRQCSTSSSFS